MSVSYIFAIIISLVEVPALRNVDSAITAVLANKLTFFHKLGCCASMRVVVLEEVMPQGVGCITAKSGSKSSCHAPHQYVAHPPGKVVHC